MRKDVPDGTTLIISGPASATTVEGKATVLGMELTIGRKLVVRRGKALPFEADGSTSLDIVLGAEARVEEVKGSTIPVGWWNAVAEVLAHPKPCTIMVLGDVDTGKTSFSIFLLNMALQHEVQPALIDVDLGQSDIGPPTSIGFCPISMPLADLFSENPAAIFFTGHTSAKGITQRVELGLKVMLDQVAERKGNVTVINTDGWISGDDAHAYKRGLIHTARADVLVGVQRHDELEPLLGSMEQEGVTVLRVSASPAVTKRGREARQALREQSYKKYLGNPTMRSLQMNWIALEYTPLGQGTRADVPRIVALERALQTNIVYSEESEQAVFIVIETTGRVEEDAVSAAETLLQKDIYVVKDGEEAGLLVSVLNTNREFLGLGILSKLDYVNRTMKIGTACKDKISIVQFSQVKISEAGTELGVATAFSPKRKNPALET
jgi:polynucleotide 5'-hydroxyl-kinase GRC3/NOL9